MVARNFFRLGKMGMHRVRRIAPILLLGLSPAVLLANPTGGTVVAGSATIATSGNTLNVNTTTTQTIINWNSFSIAGGEITDINQPNSASATLNRVTGGNLSAIYGTLNSNGSVILINPNGVLIGKGGQVNTQSFTASTLNLSDSAFLAGGNQEYQGASLKKVVNLGKITANGGDVFLISQHVVNKGTLTAANGTVGLGAGSDVTVAQAGTANQRLSVALGGTAIGGTGVNNQGTIQALKAELKANGNIYSLAVNNGGLIQATGSANVGGQVWLTGFGGTVKNTGTIKAHNANGTGGTIETSGNNVQIGGTILTGQGGIWTIDPIVIDNSGDGTTDLATLEGDLNAGGTVNEDASDDIDVAAAISWTGTGILNLDSGGTIEIGADITGTSGGLTLTAGNTISATGAINVGSFILNGGNWVQNSATLPSFTAGSFTLNGGTFLRVLGGDGTSGTPYLLTDVYGLQGVSGFLDSNFTLANNIDASGTSGWNSGAGFVPIGQSTAYSGTFDGAGHTISGLTINDSTDTYVGLFGQNSGTILNLGLVGDSVAGTAFIGGLAGENTGTITSSYATGNVSGGDGVSVGLVSIGGLVGYNYFGGITSSYTTGSVSGGAYAEVGGLVGYDGSRTLDSYATGNVSAEDTAYAYVGGLVGINDFDIISSYATGNVSGGAQAGGLAGRNNFTITSCYATGNVSDGDVGDFGGLVGANINGMIEDSYATGNVSNLGSNINGGIFVGGLAGANEGTIEDSYATGNVSRGVDIPDYFEVYVGGLVGFNVSGVISYSYATGNVSGGDHVGGLAGGNGDNGSMIEYSYATGSVSGGAYADVGGLVGTNNGGTNDGGTIDYSYATGSVSSGIYVGGLVGSNESGTITDSYWNTTTSGTTIGVALDDTGGATGLTTDQMFAASSYSTNFLAGWNMIDGSTIPYLSWQSVVYGTTDPSLGAVTVSVNGAAQGTLTDTSRYVALLNSALTSSDVVYASGAVGASGTIQNGFTGNAAALNVAAGGLSVSLSGAITATNLSTLATTFGLSSYYSMAGDDLILATNLSLGSTGDITLGGVSGSAYSLTLNSGGTATTTGAINVGSFILNGGNWVQNSATLPSFSATNFTLNGGTFLRVLGGNGSSGTPYQLTDVYGLQGINGFLGSDFALANNIDASGTVNWNSGAGFAPIGESTAYGGTFDGAGHTISGLTIDDSTDAYVGLFGQNNSGTIENVGLVGGSVAGTASDAYVGGLVGYNTGTITSSYVTGSVSGGEYVGGLVGKSYGGTIMSSYATGNVSGEDDSYVGGLVGDNESVLEDSYATGSVSGANPYAYVGGLVGDNNGLLEDSYATGNVIGGDYADVGGLAGHNGDRIFDYSYATGNVSGGVNAYIGGLVGINDFDITSSYATGNVSGGVQVGGLVGRNNYDIMSCYATGNVSDGNVGTVGGLVGSNVIGTIEDSYATGNVSDLGSNINGSIFVGGLVGGSEGIIEDCYATGSVSGGAFANDYFEIYVGGLMGFNGGGVISDSYATGSVSGGAYAGGLVGGNGATIEDSYATGSVSGGAYAYVGGLVGNNDGGAINDSYATGGVSNGIYVGGLVGSNGSGTIADSYWNMTTSGTTLGVALDDTGGATGLTTDQMFSAASYDPNFLAAWNIVDGSTLPYLSWQSVVYGTTNSDLGAVTATLDGAAQTVFTNSAGGFVTLLPGFGSSDVVELSSATGNAVTVGTGLGTGATALTLTADTLTVATGGALTAATFSTLATDLPDLSAYYTVSGGNLTLLDNLSLTSASTITLGGVSGSTETLTLDSAGTSTATGAVNVGSFILNGGNWVQNANGGTLPAFSAANDFEINNGATFLRVLGGDGLSTATAYQIADVYGLQGMNGFLGSDFTLANAINASGTATWNAGAGFIPIGENSSYTGTFDGAGYTINGLTINDSADFNVGLFAQSQGSIENVGLVDSSVTGSNPGGPLVGGLVGWNQGTITSSYVTGSISGGDESTVGGLVGENEGNITSSYSTANVTGGDDSAVGGLSGYDTYGTITSSYATGSVSGGVDAVVGGLVGTGGLNSQIHTSYATGSVSGGSGADVGGLVGLNEDFAGISDSYWDTTTSGTTIGIGLSVNGASATGLTTDQMFSVANYDANFLSAWNIIDGYTVPYLTWQSAVYGSVNSPVGTLSATVDGIAVTPAGSYLGNDSYYLILNTVLGSGDTVVVTGTSAASVTATVSTLPPSALANFVRTVVATSSTSGSTDPVSGPSFTLPDGTVVTIPTSTFSPRLSFADTTPSGDGGVGGSGSKKDGASAFHAGSSSGSHSPRALAAASGVAYAAP